MDYQEKVALFRFLGARWAESWSFENRLGEEHEHSTMILKAQTVVGYYLTH